MSHFLDTIIGKPGTIRTYKNLLPHIERKFILLKRIDEEYLEEAALHWLEKFKPNTVKSLIYLTKQYAKWKYGTDLSIKRIVRKVSTLEQQKAPKVLMKTQVAELLTHLKSRKLFKVAHISEFALNTGMRYDEIISLRLKDINLNTGKVYIQYNTKTSFSRVIDLPAPLVLNMKNWGLQDPPFTSKNPNKTLKYNCKQLSLPPITMHCFRHMFATYALESGLSPAVVAKHLGHRSVKTTLDTYWNVTNPKFSFDFLKETTCQNSSR